MPFCHFVAFPKGNPFEFSLKSRNLKTGIFNKNKVSFVKMGHCNAIASLFASNYLNSHKFAFMVLPFSHFIVTSLHISFER